MRIITPLIWVIAGCMACLIVKDGILAQRYREVEADHISVAVVVRVPGYQDRAIAIVCREGESESAEPELAIDTGATKQ